MEGHIELEAQSLKEHDKVAQLEQEMVAHPESYKVVEHLLSVAQLAQKLDLHLDPEDISQSKGLSNEQVLINREKHGPNKLVPPRGPPEILKLLRHFVSLFNVLLQVCAICSFLSYFLEPSTYDNVYVGVVLYLIVLQDVVTNYLQGRKSDRLMRQFTKMLPQNTQVIREGKVQVVAASCLVVGDLVKISMGDKLGADIRILVCKGLKTELSMINGESEQVECQVQSANDDPLYSRNLVFNGCLAVEGEALGVVIRVGSDTFIGKVAQQTGLTAPPMTSLQKEIRHTVKMVFYIGSVQALCTLILGFSQGREFLDALVNGFVLTLIANIPQGLPSTVSFSLNLVAKRMAQKNIFVKSLQTLETMGCATVIGSDKTGTLTMNQMEVKFIWIDGTVVPAALCYNNTALWHKRPSFHSLLKVQALCNRAFFKNDDSPLSRPEDPLFKKSNFSSQKVEHDSLASLPSPIQNRQHRSSHLNRVGPVLSQLAHRSLVVRPQQSMYLQDQLRHSQREELQRLAQEQFRHMDRRKKDIVGDASESALLAYADRVTGDVQHYQHQHPKIFEVPFNSRNKWQLSIHDVEGKQETVIKGAPEVILSLCSYYRSEGQVLPISEEFKHRFHKTYTLFAKQGQRVLGFGWKDHGQDQSILPGGEYVFEGLSSLVDPPKPKVDEAVLRCKLAGIRVFMLTGDHPLTAEAIARQTGIIHNYKTKEELEKEQPGLEIDELDIGAAVVYGPELENYNEEQWTTLLIKQELVFARITPQQKTEITRRLQGLGQVVAITGDGVNDAIALRQADIGIAMGDKGSAVAKEAADILFMDDNFSSILLAIEQGRLLFDNLRKAIAYIMAHLLPELLPLLLNFAIGLPLGLSALQLLSIDLFTELAPAISLSYESKEDKLMERPPRDVKKDKLFDYRVVLYSYVQASIITSTFCFLAYCQVFWLKGISLDQLYQSANTYWKYNSPPFPLNNGSFLSADEQISLRQEAATSYYVTLIMIQFVHLFACRTRSASIFQHGVFSNVMSIYGVTIEILLLVFFVYTPHVQTLLRSYPVDYYAWLLWIPAGLFYMVTSEIRKYASRKDPQGCNRFLNW